MVILYFLVNVLWVQKIIILINVIAIPLSFFYLIQQLKRGSEFFSIFLILPFAFSYFLYYGFFNFNLSISFSLICIGYWLRHYEDFSLKHSFRFSLLVMCCFFSHIFSFFILLIFLSVFFVYGFIKKDIKNKSITNTIISLVPWLILTSWYFLRNTGSGIQIHSISILTVVKSILEISPLKGNNPYYDNYIHPLYLILLSTIILGSIIFNFKRPGKNSHAFIPFILMSASLLLLAFIVPEALFSGGYITNRFIYYFFLFTIISITIAGNYSHITKYCSIAFLILFLFQLYFKTKTSIHYSREIEKIKELNDHIEDNSVLLPVHFQTDWTYTHVSNYTSINKAVINLENYEATNSYFPLKWRTEVPYSLVDHFYQSPENLRIQDYNKTAPYPIRYLLLVFDNGSDKLKIEECIIIYNSFSYIETFRTSGNDLNFILLKRTS